MTPQILVASHREEDYEFCLKLSHETGFVCTRILNDDELRSALIANPKSLLFCEVDSEDLGLKNPISFRLLGNTIQKSLAPKSVFGLANVPLFELSPLIKTSALGHFLLRKYDDFGVAWVARICKNLHSNALSIENFKDPETTIQKIILKGSTEKKVALEAFRRLLEKKSIQGRAIEVILSALDELIMNAVYDAPKDLRGRHYQREMLRSTEFKFKEKEYVTISIALSEKFVTLSVLDQFGSFEPERALGAAMKNHTETEYVANQKTQAAGLGIQGIAANGVSLVIAAQPNQSTEACLSFPYFKSLKEARNAFRSFSLIKL